MTIRSALRQFAPALLMAAMLAVAVPAEAFCVHNRTSLELIVKLETPNPLGRFHYRFLPGQQRCCDWFNRRCNPTGRSDSLLNFSVRNKNPKYGSKYCAEAPGRRVYGISNGAITITEFPGKLGGLQCDSRDLLGHTVTSRTFTNRRGRIVSPIVPPPRSDEPTVEPGSEEEKAATKEKAEKKPVNDITAPLFGRQRPAEPTVTPDRRNIFNPRILRSRRPPPE